MPRSVEVGQTAPLLKAVALIPRKQVGHFLRDLQNGFSQAEFAGAAQSQGEQGAAEPLSAMSRMAGHRKEGEGPPLRTKNHRGQQKASGRFDDPNLVPFMAEAAPPGCHGIPALFFKTNSLQLKETDKVIPRGPPGSGKRRQGTGMEPRDRGGCRRMHGAWRAVAVTPLASPRSMPPA